MSEFSTQFAALQRDVHRVAVAKGWWDAPREDGTCIALMHSELSEALEELRKPQLQDSGVVPDFLAVTEELADVVIRIMDFAERKHLSLGQAIEAKHEYNQTRSYKHGGKAF